MSTVLAGLCKPSEGEDAMPRNSGASKGMGKADRASKKRGKQRFKIEASKHTHRQRNT